VLEEGVVVGVDTHVEVRDLSLFTGHVESEGVVGFVVVVGKVGRLPVSQGLGQMDVFEIVTNLLKGNGELGFSVEGSSSDAIILVQIVVDEEIFWDETPLLEGVGFGLEDHCILVGFGFLQSVPEFLVRPVGDQELKGGVAREEGQVVLDVVELELVEVSHGNSDGLREAQEPLVLLEARRALLRNGVDHERFRKTLHEKGGHSGSLSSDGVVLEVLPGIGGLLEDGEETLVAVLALGVAVSGQLFVAELEGLGLLSETVGVLFEGVDVLGAKGLGSTG
jgi:hypothetical protein